MSTDPNWGAVYYDHYVKYLRSPRNRKIFSQGEGLPRIQILEFDHVFQGCRVFASVGASHYSEILGQRAEVVLPCDAGWDMVGYVLANSLFSLVRDRKPLGRGVGLAGIEKISPEFVRHFGKSAIYFSNPVGFPDAFPVVSNGDEIAHIYIAIFISGNEFNYFCDRGAVEFETFLEQSSVDPFQLSRRSAV